MTKTVAIIGAGIVGVSTAIWAQRAGMKVILIDRDGPAAGTSFGNGGVLASSSVVPVSTPGLMRKAPGMLFDPKQPLFLKWSYLPKLLPYLIKYLGHANAEDARKRAEAMAPIVGDSLADHQALAEGTGAERWIVPSDYLFIYNNRAHYDGDAFGWGVRKDLGFAWDEMEETDFRAYDPVFGPELKFAAKLGDHGRISDPGAYVKALAAHAEAEGAQFIRADVSDIVRENGKVTGIRAGGETIPCDSAVVATGAWSGPLAKALGVSVPLESERGYHIELWEPNIVPRAPVMIASGKFVITPMEGRLRLAGIVEFGGLDAKPSRAPFDLLETFGKAALPGLRWSEKTEWMGHRPAMADSTPMIGEVPGIAGAYLGFGHDHVGLTGGPKTGRLLGQMLAGTPPNIDMSPYSPARYMRH